MNGPLPLGAVLELRDPSLLALLVLPAWLWLRRPVGPALTFAPAALLTPRGAGVADAAVPGGAAAPERFPTSWRVATRWLPRALELLGLVCVVVALARPVERVPLPVRTEGIDIVLCLDTSSSMSANDMDRRRTRLEVAKDAAAKFVRGRPDDRIGLVTFARYPDLRCPLTLDHEALTKLLEGVGTAAGDGPEDATGLGTAVARAAQVLEGSVGSSRVVILLTDGEENVALSGVPGEIAPVHAAQLCRQLGVKVHVIAAGVGRVKPSGETVPLDTTSLRLLAEKTGGTFQAARDAGAVASVYATIDRMEKATFVEPKETTEDRFLPFLLAAIALVGIGRLLGVTLWQETP